jgi:hypothetical protein
MQENGSPGVKAVAGLELVSGTSELVPFRNARREGEDAPSTSSGQALATAGETLALRFFPQR